MTNKYSDWTDDQVNREIAQRSGWRDEQHHQWWIVWGQYNHFECRDLDRDTAWVLALHRAGRNCAFDMNSAVTLLKECDGELTFDRHCGLWECSIAQADDTYLMTNCEQPARAICEAWLLWKDSQQQEGGTS